MDLGPAAPDGSSITAILFLEYGRFRVGDRDAGILLCIGITAEELAACMSGKHEEVLAAIKESGVYPYTDLYRQSAYR